MDTAYPTAAGPLSAGYRALGKPAARSPRGATRAETRLVEEAFTDPAWEAQLQAVRTHQPQLYPGRITLLRAQLLSGLLSANFHKWASAASGGLDLQVVPGAHDSMLREPYVAEVAERLRACLGA